MEQTVCKSMLLHCILVEIPHIVKNQNKTQKNADAGRSTAQDLAIQNEGAAVSSSLPAVSAILTASIYLQVLTAQVSDCTTCRN